MKRKVTLEEYGFTITKRLKIGCEISDLPNEMLREIFKNLPTTDRLNARIVSNFWMELLNEYFQDDNTVELSGEMDFSSTGSLYQTFKARLSSTKEMRVFSRLSISWWPEEKLSDLVNFMKLVGDEIRYLHIWCYSSAKSINDIYENLPNLESLEICKEVLLGNFKFPSKLKMIKIGNQFTQVHKLPDILKISSLKHFSAECFFINKNTDALAFILDPKLKTLLDYIFGDNALETDSITLHSDFNFCGEGKLLAKNITKAKIHQKILNIAPLAEFNNLEQLVLQISNANALMHATSLNECIKLPSVTNLAIRAIFGNQLSNRTLPHTDKLLRKFINLESLSITAWKLTTEDFLTICQHMSRLKYLYFSSSKISIKTLFDLNNSSLKDLKSIKSLSVQTKPENLHSLQVAWPALPNMKTINLKGAGFRYLKQGFYTQMAQNSPQIEEFEIYYHRNLVENQPSKFLPLLKLQNLENLSVPGEGQNNSLTHNSVLVDNVITHCKKLQRFMINDDNGFSLAQEIRMFRSLPSLKIVISESLDTELAFRAVERSEFENLKEYLVENIHDYKDLNETIFYLYNFEIPQLERILMETDFDSKHEESHLKIWYIVLYGYLKMSPLDFCRTLHIATH